MRVLQVMQAAADEEEASGTQLTVHSTLWHTSPLLLYQEPMRDIGFKLYPAALAALALIEAASKIEGDNSAIVGPPSQLGVQADYRGKSYKLSLHLKGLNVLELGAGACGVGAIAAAAAGASSSLATDTQAVLPVLRQNIHTARELLKAHALPDLPVHPSDSLGTAEFLWGSAHSTYADSMAAQPPPQVILGADIVYYEELIDPLLHALKWLCTPGGGVPLGHGAPLVVLTYVQRVRKAKAFTKRAVAAGFSLDVYQLPHVVDYDVLLHRALHPASRFAANPLDAAEPPPTVPTPPPRTAHFQSEDVWYANAPEVSQEAAVEALQDAPEAPPPPPNAPGAAQGGAAAPPAQPKAAWEDFDAPLHLGIGGDSDSDAFSDDSAEFLARTQPEQRTTPAESEAPDSPATGSHSAVPSTAAPTKFCAPSKCFVYVLKFKGVPCSAADALRAVSCASD